MCAFGGLFTALSVTFAPMAAFGLTVLACLVLSQMEGDLVRIQWMPTQSAKLGIPKSPRSSPSLVKTTVLPVSPLQTGMVVLLSAAMNDTP
jgi:hypothetical protein